MSNIHFWVGGNAHKLSSIKKIECTIWETLNKAQFGDEKLAQGEYDGYSKNDEVFYTPLRSLDNEGSSFTTLPN